MRNVLRSNTNTNAQCLVSNGMQSFTEMFPSLHWLSAALLHSGENPLALLHSAEKTNKCNSGHPLAGLHSPIHPDLFANLPIYQHY